MTMIVQVPTRVVAATLADLQAAGRDGSECVVLWLGARGPKTIDVVEMYRPEQIAAEDFFTIPRASIAALLGTLGPRNLMVAAQVHSHPHEAFHSLADDRWAIVRHVGALSIVLPDFALKTTAKSFFEDAAVFALSEANIWTEVMRNGLASHLREVP